MTTIEDLKRDKTPTKPPIEPIGLVWMSMLIEFNYKTGESKILRSFSRPAKDSTIKQFKQPKKKDNKPDIKFKEPTKSTNLF